MSIVTGWLREMWLMDILLVTTWIQTEEEMS